MVVGLVFLSWYREMCLALVVVVMMLKMSRCGCGARLWWGFGEAEGVVGRYFWGTFLIFSFSSMWLLGIMNFI